MLAQCLTDCPVCMCSFHDQLVLLFTSMPEKEGLQPDYDSYSAVVKSYLKEAVCAYRQFSPSHPASRVRGKDVGHAMSAPTTGHTYVTARRAVRSTCEADSTGAQQVGVASTPMRLTFSRSMKTIWTTWTLSSQPISLAALRTPQAIPADRRAAVRRRTCTPTALLPNTHTCRLRLRRTSHG